MSNFLNDLKADLGNNDLMGSLSGGNADFKPLPNGWYEVEINNIEIKSSTSDSSKEYMSIRFNIISGEHKGRCHFESLFMTGYSEKAVAFSRKKIAKIIQSTEINFDPATGIDGLISSLKGKLVDIHLKIEENNYNGETKLVNRIPFYDIEPVSTKSASTPKPSVSDMDGSIPF